LTRVNTAATLICVSGNDHPDKDLREAVDYALSEGWHVEKATGGSAHPWGKLFCPGGRACCMAIVVYSTPKQPRRRADQIHKKVDQCRAKRQASEERS
jgi:hypothetical protein